MANKPAFTIANQVALLKQRGMLFKDESNAQYFLENISYYRLKGYWWDLQNDPTLHTFKPDIYFEDIISYYNFDRHLRLILFDAIERIEIALRTKLIYHLSVAHGGLWYLNPALFESTIIDINGIQKTIHLHTLDELKKEFERSKEVFVKDHHTRHPNTAPDAWKILEVASMGTLSKLYKNLKHQLPEKAIIAQGMGLNLHNELSSWLEAITYIRNIIAHHSRLWSKNLVKTPIENINKPIGLWHKKAFIPIQTKRAFLITTCMIYICNHVSPGHHIKTKILDLIDTNPTIPIQKLGFSNQWRYQPIWNV